MCKIKRLYISIQTKRESECNKKSQGKHMSGFKDKMATSNIIKFRALSKSANYNIESLNISLIQHHVYNSIRIYTIAIDTTLSNCIGKYDKHFKYISKVVIS